MNSAAQIPIPTIGFLTIVEGNNETLLGGYLILNRQARPLEFHCTAPVRPNRAQEILYGHTLGPYLYGELIGQTLLKSSKLRPSCVLTDVFDALSIAEHSLLPLAFLSNDPASAADKTDHIEISGTRFTLPSISTAQARRDQDEKRIRSTIEALPSGFDIREPFDRIRLAIEEAHRDCKSRKSGAARAA